MSDGSVRFAPGAIQMRVAQDIGREIERLVWQGSNIPLTEEEKVAIVRELKELIAIRELENKNYLILVNHVLAQVKTK